MRSLALMGAGSGGFDAARVLALMIDALADQLGDVATIVVRFARRAR